MLCYEGYSDKNDEIKGWVSVIIDILLKLLSLPAQQSFLRVVVKQAFTFLIPILTMKEMNLITDVSNIQPALYYNPQPTVYFPTVYLNLLICPEPTFT